MHTNSYHNVILLSQECSIWNILLYKTLTIRRQYLQCSRIIVTRSKDYCRCIRTTICILNISTYLLKNMVPTRKTRIVASVAVNIFYPSPQPNSFHRHGIDLGIRRLWIIRSFSFTPPSSYKNYFKPYNYIFIICL